MPLRPLPLLAGALLAVPAVAAAQDRPDVVRRVSSGALRVSPGRGGALEVAPRAVDSTLALELRARGARRGDEPPRATVAVRPSVARRFAADIDALVGEPAPYDTVGHVAALSLDLPDGTIALSLVRGWQRDAKGRVRDSVIVEGLAAGGAARVVLSPPEALQLVDVLRATAATVAGDQPGRVLFEFEVEQPVSPSAASCIPKYPFTLRVSPVTGEVQTQFVVGTDGRVEPGTFRVLFATHSEFAQSVLEAVPCMRFKPARAAGAPVRQMVQQPFVFDVMRSSDDVKEPWRQPPPRP